MKKETAIILLLVLLAMTFVAGLVFYWQFSSKEVALEKSEHQMAALKEKVAQLEAEQQAMHVEVDKQSETFKEILTAEQHMAELENAVQAKERELIEARKKIEGLQKQLEDIKGQRLPGEEAMASLEQRAHEVQLELLACQEKTRRDQVIVENFQRQISELQQQKSAAEGVAQQMEATSKALVAGLQEQLKSEEVTLKELKEKLTLTMVDRILFRFGEVAITPRGKQILDKVGEALKDIKDAQIRVVGHTDNTPIAPEFRYKYPTNWELSVDRAAAVVRYFQEVSGIAPELLEASGRSFYQPVAPNTTPDDRAKNRRVEILIAPTPD